MSKMTVKQIVLFCQPLLPWLWHVHSPNWENCSVKHPSTERHFPPVHTGCRALTKDNFTCSLNKRDFLSPIGVRYTRNEVQEKSPNFKGTKHTTNDCDWSVSLLFESMGTKKGLQVKNNRLRNAVATEACDFMFVVPAESPSLLGCTKGRAKASWTSAQPARKLSGCGDGNIVYSAPVPSARTGIYLPGSDQQIPDRTWPPWFQVQKN